MQARRKSRHDPWAPPWQVQPAPAHPALHHRPQNPPQAPAEDWERRQRYCQAGRSSLGLSSMTILWLLVLGAPHCTQASERNLDQWEEPQLTDQHSESSWLEEGGGEQLPWAGAANNAAQWTAPQVLPGAMDSTTRLPARRSLLPTRIKRHRMGSKLVKRRIRRHGKHVSAGSGIQMAANARAKKPGRIALWGGAYQLPTRTFPGFYTPRAAVWNKGRCFRGRREIRLPVRRYDDILKRIRVPWWRVVVLEVQNDFSLPKSLVLSKNFSCTYFVAKAGVKPTIRAQWSDEPGISFWNAHNIVFRGVNFKYGISEKSKICDAEIFFFGKEASSLTCPGIYIVMSYGIQITMAQIYGRIDVFRSIFVKLDSLVVTTAKNAYNKKLPYEDFGTFGVIRMGETNVPGTYRSSNNVISNCDVSNHWELITIFRGAVGVTVRNNYLHDFLFVAIRCGAFSSFIMDCHHNYIGFNYIWNKPAWATDVTATDNSGVYMALHWFNPDNYITCNYIENQRQCLYFDEVSSGITVEGGMCTNGYVAVKVNGGKFNRVTSLVIVKNLSHLTHITCHYVRKERFPQDEHPRKWEGLRRMYWNAPAINAVYPYMKSICNPVPTKINGQPCNPSGGLSASDTGKCSGLPYSNYIESFAYEPSRKLAIYLNCDDVPSVDKINKQVWWNTTAPAYRRSFINPAAMNFGLRWFSPIWKFRPNFKSCPRGAVGRKAVNPRTYNWDFNIPKPAYFDAMVNFDMGLIINGSIEATS